jgi:hypothetical protein
MTISNQKKIFFIMDNVLIKLKSHALKLLNHIL